MPSPTITHIISLPHAEREQTFVDLCVEQPRKETLAQINELLPQLTPEQQHILVRWKAELLLRDAEKNQREDWEFIIRDHLFESLCTGRSLEEAIIYYLYERAHTHTELQADQAVVERAYRDLKALLEQATTPSYLGNTSMKDLVQRLMVANKDSLTFTTALTELRQLFMTAARATGVVEENVSYIAGVATDHFLACAQFLLYTEQEDVYLIVLHVVTPELFEAPEGGFSPYEFREARRTLPLYNQIAMGIRELFGDPETLSIEDMGLVMNFLQRIATEVPDEKILQLVLFDEASGTFMFNDELLYPSSPPTEDVSTDAISSL